MTLETEQLEENESGGQTEREQLKCRSLGDMGEGFEGGFFRRHGEREESRGGRSREEVWF